MGSYFVIAFFAFGSLISEENESWRLKKQEKAPTKFSVIPYVQSYYIFPGVGMSFRCQRGCWGAQLDANMADTSLFGSSYDYESSVSALYYPLARKEGGWKYGGFHLSAGLGAHLNTPHGYGVQPCSPLFLGYEGKWINLGAGVDIVYWIPYSSYYGRYMLFVTNVIPSMKLGLSF